MNTKYRNSNKKTKNKKKQNKKTQNKKSLRKYRRKYNNLNGGNGCGIAQCPIAPLNMTGGDAFPLPKSFVGTSWGSLPTEWSGVNGIPHDRNHFALNPYIKDPQTMMKLGGKRVYTKKHKNKQGGGLFPQPLQNIANDLTYNFSSAFNSVNGYPSPVNPAPYKDQLNLSKQI